MSDGIPVLKAKAVIRILVRAGFYIHHQTGSHVQLKHKIKINVRVTVPFHNKDIPKSILKSILLQSGLSLDEFNSYR